MSSMRTLPLLCALLSMTAGLSAFQAVQPAPKNPSLPPDPPPPLYMPSPRNDELRRIHEPPTEEEIQQLLRSRRGIRPVGTQGSAAAQPEGTQRPEPTDEFKPISELPPEDRLPAAPMLVGAYAFVMLAIFAYLLSLSRRLNAVARDLAKFESHTKRP